MEARARLERDVPALESEGEGERGCAQGDLGRTTTGNSPRQIGRAWYAASTTIAQAISFSFPARLGTLSAGTTTAPRPSAAAPNPMPGLAGHPPSGSAPAGPAADERLRRLREQMQLKGAGGHP